MAGINGQRTPEKRDRENFRQTAGEWNLEVDLQLAQHALRCPLERTYHCAGKLLLVFSLSMVVLQAVSYLLMSS